MNPEYVLLVETPWGVVRMQGEKHTLEALRDHHFYSLVAFRTSVIPTEVSNTVSDTPQGNIGGIENSIVSLWGEIRTLNSRINKLEYRPQQPTYQQQCELGHNGILDQIRKLQEQVARMENRYEVLPMTKPEPSVPVSELRFIVETRRRLDMLYHHGTVDLIMEAIAKAEEGAK
jgi:hypothetical protein